MERAMGRKEWIEKAEQCHPGVRRWKVRPVSLVKPVRDPGAWQGWRMQKLPSRKPLAERAFRNGGRLILDFGEELVGRLQLTLRSETNYNDSPVRLRLVFAEFPLEIADRNRKGSLVSAAEGGRGSPCSILTASTTTPWPK